jgi:hypothetical protein
VLPIQVFSFSVVRWFTTSDSPIAAWIPTARALAASRIALGMQYAALFASTRLAT